MGKKTIKKQIFAVLKTEFFAYFFVLVCFFLYSSFIQAPKYLEILSLQIRSYIIFLRLGKIAGHAFSYNTPPKKTYIAFTHNSSNEPKLFVKV